jgi:hypothetical protein
MKPLTPLLLLAPLLACSDDGGRGTAASANPVTGVTTAPATTSGDPSTGGDASSTTASSEPTGGSPTSASAGGTTDVLKFDLGNLKDLGETTGGTTGCDKVDFLFVIDNSASMEDNQAALIASFPGFIAAITGALQADYQIMVVDTDDDGRCAQPCDPNGPNYVEFCAAKSYHACTAKLTECDTTRGAGVLHPVGLYASNKLCTIAGGRRYMLPDEPDLAGSFACVAKVGTAGNPSERPMNGMTEALSPALVGPGGCNDGFLRDDAILVITFISDDPNYEDQGTPQEWYDAVVAAKNGNPDAVVVAGLIPLEEVGCAANGDIKGQHWKDFLTMWGERGIIGSVCEPDYAPFFAQAVGIIDETCDNFVPPN